MSVNVAAVFSGLAATVAAMLSGVTLYVSGRREHLKWVRAALEVAFVDFLVASYKHRAICRDLARHQAGVQGSVDAAQALRDASELRADAAQAHQVMMESVTRFRILAGDRAAEAALLLHDINDRDMEAVNRPDGSAELLAARAAGTAEFERLRDALIKEARRVLGIRVR
jgi:tRNA A37 threonylcarbamoyltransferase TsaD